MAQNSADRNILVLVLVALGVLVLFPALFMGFGMMGFGGMMGGTWGGHMWGDGGAAGWFPLLGVAMQLLFLLALVAGGYFLYRALGGGDGDDPAIEELRSAYARGDLTEEEYENRRETLERNE